MLKNEIMNSSSLYFQHLFAHPYVEVFISYTSVCWFYSSKYYHAHVRVSVIADYFFSPLGSEVCPWDVQNMLQVKVQGGHGGMSR